MVHLQIVTKLTDPFDDSLVQLVLSCTNYTLYEANIWLMMILYFLWLY